MSAEMFLRSARLSSLNSSNSEVANPNEEEKQKTSGELLAEAKEKLKDLRYQSSTLQQRSTNELIQRVKDVDLFKGDLEKEISDFTTSIDALHTTAATLSDAKVLLKRADSVNKESTQVRQNLSTYADRLDRELHKERDLVQSTLSSFTQLSERLESQMKLAETIKGQLERNWSDKSDASDLDSYALGLTQNQAAAGFKPGSIGFVETMSTLDQWHSYTDNHIKDSQQQRMEIKGFSKEIAAFLRETSRELRGQAQVIEAALVDSVRFAVEQQSTMGAMLEAKRAEIGLLRKTIGEIQAELNSKRSPLAVALARVNTRSKRPGIELCDDLAHQALLDEIGALQDVTVKLNADLDHYKDKLKQLQQEQIQLEIQHEKMVDSGKSDSDVLRNVRCLYPTRIQTTGFAAKGDSPE